MKNKTKNKTKTKYVESVSYGNLSILNKIVTKEGDKFLNQELVFGLYSNDILKIELYETLLTSEVLFDLAKQMKKIELDNGW